MGGLFGTCERSEKLLQSFVWKTAKCTDRPLGTSRRELGKIRSKLILNIFRVTHHIYLLDTGTFVGCASRDR
jgi:hypothetical protein